MNLLDGAMSVLTGGVTGLIGTVAQRVFEFKTKKLEIELEKSKFDHEVALKKVEGELMAQEWAARTQVAQVEGEAKVQVEDAKAFAAALTSEPARFSQGNLSEKQNWMMVVLDFMRGVIRPFLCLYLAVVTTMLYLDATKLLGKNLDPGQAYDLVDKVTQTILYLFTTCVLFYYGTRNQQKPPKTK